jgi:hypothetical protein
MFIDPARRCEAPSVRAMYPRSSHSSLQVRPARVNCLGLYRHGPDGGRGPSSGGGLSAISGSINMALLTEGEARLAEGT